MTPEASGSTGIRLTIYGTRGSIPSAPDDPSEFGARSCCVLMEAAGQALVFDAGSGIVECGRMLHAARRAEIDLFFGHVHYDHIMGLPYFFPLLDPDATVRIHLGHMLDGADCETVIRDFMRPPFHPVGVEAAKAKVEFRTFRPQDVLRPAADIRILTHRLNHPNGAVAYRVESGGRAVVYATDHEHTPGTVDTALTEFVRGADVLIYDTNFSDAEMERFKGYGHSSHEEGVRLSLRADVKRLLLFHHSFKNSDATLREIELSCQRDFPATTAARIGQVIDLPALGTGHSNAD
ncbi:MBL fold metallo-hydrolase [Aliihoeflea sp. PC F10.4]